MKIWGHLVGLGLTRWCRPVNNFTSNWLGRPKRKKAGNTKNMVLNRLLLLRWSISSWAICHNVKYCSQYPVWFSSLILTPGKKKLNKCSIKESAPLSTGITYMFVSFFGHKTQILTTVGSDFPGRNPSPREVVDWWAQFGGWRMNSGTSRIDLQHWKAWGSFGICRIKYLFTLDTTKSSLDILGKDYEINVCKPERGLLERTWLKYHIASKHKNISTCSDIKNSIKSSKRQKNHCCNNYCSCIQRLCAAAKVKYLVGGWTNPSEKYARQIGSFPPFSWWKFQKYLKRPPPIDKKYPWRLTWNIIPWRSGSDHFLF